MGNATTTEPIITIMPAAGDDDNDDDDHDDDDDRMERMTRCRGGSNDARNRSVCCNKHASGSRYRRIVVECIGRPIE